MLLHYHGEALEADLIERNLRLRWVNQPGRDFTWFDLWAVVAHLPLGSALYRELQGFEGGWSMSEFLSAQQLNALRGANWQRSGAKTKDRPKPIEIPGLKNETGITKHKPDAMDIDEFNRRIGWA